MASDIENAVALSETTTLINSKRKSETEQNGYEIITTDLQYNKKSSNKNDDKNDTAKNKDEISSGLKTFSTFSGRRKYTLVLITLASCLAGMSFSMLGPFYPTEAAKKGMDNTTVGFVFGVFELIIFITAPIYGAHLVQLGPRFVFIAGIFVGGSCNILFGTLQYCPSGTPFIVMSILVRSVEAFGFSAFITSSFAIVASEFKENVAFTFGILETGTGVGFTLGPTVGGALFELGGFGFPFYFAGCAVLLNGIAVYKLLPQIEQVPVKRKRSMFALLRNPMVMIPLLSVSNGVVGITTFDSTFAKHIQSSNLSVATVGLLFAMVALLYSLMSSIWGYLSDTKDVQAPIIILGHFIFGIGFFLMGPSVLLPFLSYNLVTILIGSACIGLSFGCTLIPTMKCMVIGATDMGFENSMDTYGLVSGLFNSAHTFAGFLGPVGSGYLIDKFDYPIAYTVIALSNIFMMVLSLIFFTVRRFRRRGLYKNIGNIESYVDSNSTTKYVSKNDNAIIPAPFHRSLSLSLDSD